MIYRVRKLSEMTENMSQVLLSGVLSISGSVTAPLVHSKAGKAFFNMLPGEVLLASLAAVGKKEYITNLQLPHAVTVNVLTCRHSSRRSRSR